MDVKEPNDATGLFIEQMGLLTQADGVPRIAGRVLGLMVAEGQAFSLQEMALRLRVSRASISTNARLLASHGVSRPGERQDYYQLSPHLYRQIIETMRDNMRHKAKLVAGSARNFGDGQDEQRQRICELAQFYTDFADRMEEWSRMHD